MLAVAFLVYDLFLFQHQFECTRCPEQQLCVKGELHYLLVDKNTEERQHFSPAALHICSTTDLCLSTNANCNNVFRSSFTNQLQYRGRALLFFLFFPQSKHCCQGNLFVLCSQRAPSDSKPKQGIIKCIYTHVNIQILFQIQPFLSILKFLQCHHFW